MGHSLREIVRIAMLGISCARRWTLQKGCGFLILFFWVVYWAEILLSKRALDWYTCEARRLIIWTLKGSLYVTILSNSACFVQINVGMIFLLVNLVCLMDDSSHIWQGRVHYAILARCVWSLLSRAQRLVPGDNPMRNWVLRWSILLSGGSLLGTADHTPLISIATSLLHLNCLNLDLNFLCLLSQVRSRRWIDRILRLRFGGWDYN